MQHQFNFVLTYVPISGGEPEVTAQNGLSDVVIVIIVAACVGLLLAVVLGIACYFHYKRTR